MGTERKVDGPEQIVELYKGWKQAFPDAAGTVTGAFASGDTAVLEVTWKGTHTGPLTTAEETIPASGKRQRVTGDHPDFHIEPLGRGRGCDLQERSGSAGRMDTTPSLSTERT